MTLRPTWLFICAALVAAGCRSAAPPVPTPMAPALPAPGLAAPAAAPAAADTVARTTARGAGAVNEGVDRVQFSFVVKHPGMPGGISASGTIDGKKLTLLGDAAEVTIATGEVVFNGVAVLDGKPATFTVRGTDGPFDTFSLAISDGRDIQGQLAHGHVDIE